MRSHVSAWPSESFDTLGRPTVCVPLWLTIRDPVSTGPQQKHLQSASSLIYFIRILTCTHEDGSVPTTYLLMTVKH